ncbi:MAG: hypothetical protein R3A50_08240 [Saprospiraceae bacterium]
MRRNIRKYKLELFSIALLFLYLVLGSCNNNAPLDASIRIAIDSISNAKISKARLEIDSLCTLSEKRDLPKLVDSIKRHREREIEQQLKTIPK